MTPAATLGLSPVVIQTSNSLPISFISPVFVCLPGATNLQHKSLLKIDCFHPQSRQAPQRNSPGHRGIDASSVVHQSQGIAYHVLIRDISRRLVRAQFRPEIQGVPFRRRTDKRSLRLRIPLRRRRPRHQLPVEQQTSGETRAGEDATSDFGRFGVVYRRV